MPLDVLRALAIGLVLGRHIFLIPSQAPNLTDRFFSAWQKFGWIGVDLFFVLSGFLVGGLLIQEASQHGTISPIRFLARRGLKIYPAFYFFLGASILLARLQGLRVIPWSRALLGEMFFLQNYVGHLWPQTWSLAVEEHFYLALVFLVMGLGRRRPGGDGLRPLPWIVLGINSVILASRVIAVAAWKMPWSSLISFTHFRLDGLLFGVFLAYLYHRQPDRLRRLWRLLAPWRVVGLSLLIGPMLVLPLETSPYVYTVGFTMLYLGFGWILIETLLNEGIPRLIGPRALPWIAAIGRHSYSIYLWHYTIYICVVSGMRRWSGGAGSLLLDAAVYLAAATVFGMAMSLAIERPVLRWRDRRLPSRQNPI